MSVEVCLFALLIYSQPWGKKIVFLCSPSTVDFLLLSKRCHHSSKTLAHRYVRNYLCKYKNFGVDRVTWLV